jgi:hypothetical protein
MFFTLCFHVLRSSSFSLNMLLNLSRVGVWGKQLILQLYYSLFCEKIQSEKLFGKQLHPTFELLIPKCLVLQWRGQAKEARWAYERESLQLQRSIWMQVQMLEVYFQEPVCTMTLMDWAIINLARRIALFVMLIVRFFCFMYLAAPSWKNL